MDITMLISVVIFSGIFFVSYAFKCIFNYSLFKKVGWIIAPYRERNLPQRYNTSLLREIAFKQQDLDIPKDLRLKLWDNKSDIEHTKEILKVFKKDISELYFGGFLSNKQKIRKLQDDCYFMYRLFVFCEKYSKLESHELKDKIYKFESIDGSYSTYSLTDFGTTFYKLYLVSLLYVENNPYTLKLCQYIDAELKEYIKTHLNTKKVKFRSYRT